jgi:hypothetical protein
VSEIDLTAPEVQAAITAAVEKATAPLVAKRDELLGEVKKLRKNSEIDPADLEKVESERDQFKAQLAEANKSLGKATKDLDAATKRAEQAEGASTSLLVENGLNDALTKAGVTNPVHQKAAKAMLAGQVQIVADGESRVAKVGDKALGEFITEWAGSDEGKHFVAATPASGGGAHGGNRGASNQTGNLGGTRAERTAAIAARFPDLPK